MIRVIILDFDGVVVESVDLKTEAFRKFFGLHFPDHVKEIVEYHVANNGVSRMIKFAHIYNHILHISYTKEIEQKVSIEFSKMVIDQVITCPMVPGAQVFLEGLHRCVPIYVSSATPESELRAIIDRRRLGLFFKDVFGYPTNKVQAIEEVARREKVSAPEILFIGDSLEDFKVASSAGVRFLARKNKFNFSGLNVSEFKDLGDIFEYLTNAELDVLNK